MIEKLFYRIRNAAAVAWLIARHRPFFTCPFCRGRGGEMSGYEEPEWSECSACWEHWKDLEDHYVRWAVGRLPVMEYLRARASIRAGLWYSARFRDLIRCRIGAHRWMSPEDSHCDGRRICCCCYSVEGVDPKDED